MVRKVYNKLVRDKIIEIIEKDNCKPVYHVADDSEYLEELYRKLIEETKEFKEDPSEKELSDILEVVYALRDYYNLDKDSVEKMRLNRASKRGSFKKKIVLEYVDE